MIELIKQALAVAGYDVEPTVDALRECFADYVDSGAWSNLHLVEGEVESDNGEIITSIKAMARALIRLGVR